MKNLHNLDTILESFDGMNRANPSNEFESQLFNKISNLESQSIKKTKIWMIAAMWLIIVINLFSVFYILNFKNTMVVPQDEWVAYLELNHVDNYINE